MEDINTLDLPLHLREKLAELDIELSEGDITEKGYLKKKAKILEPFLKEKLKSTSKSGESSKEIESSVPSSKHQPRRDGRRYTRDEARYRSDIREEAVKEALARSHQREQAVLLPSKRRDPSKNGKTNDQKTCSHQLTEQDSESDDEDDTDVVEVVAPTEITSQTANHPGIPISLGVTPLSRTKKNASRSGSVEPSEDNSSHDYFTDMPSNTLRKKQQGANRSSSDPHPPNSLYSQATPLGSRLAASIGGLKLKEMVRRGSQDSEASASSRSASSGDSNKNKGAFGAPPDVTHNTTSQQRRADILLAAGNLPPGVASAIDNYALHSDFKNDPDDRANHNSTPNSTRTNQHKDPPLTANSRVSDKILQLVNTLKRPKPRPLPEYFQEEPDNQIPIPTLDPTAPQPKGHQSQPVSAEDCPVPSGLPSSLEGALIRYSSSSPKSLVLTCLDSHAKPTNQLTYGKLYQRANRIAYLLLNKLGHRGDLSLKPRDRVALVYTNNDPINFMCAFYGCLTAGVVPLAIEVPLMRRDASCQSMGFLLNSQEVRVVLTSEQCYKALPRNNNGEIVAFSGWPKVHWINTDQLSSVKPSKDWVPPDRLADDETVYIEYTYGKDGSVRGVMVSRSAMLAHCRALSIACHYQEDDVMVCVVDAKKETGLWHAILSSVFNGMHVIFVPYSVMKIEPASWLKMITKFKANAAIVKSRDMHWALLSEKDHSNVDLKSLRMLLVADGANPWSLTSCDSFLSKFRSYGLRSDAICPCASSSETMTLSMRRPPAPSETVTRDNSALSDNENNGSRGVLSMFSLSCGVVRVDSENSLTSLTLQDCGKVLTGGTAVIVKTSDEPYLCKTDEVGEICLSSRFTGSGYYGLSGLTNSTYKVQPLNSDGRPIDENITYVRSGLLGFFGPASSKGLIFICGSKEGMITSAGRRHNADDVIATVLAVEPMRIIYRGRITVFSVPILKDERIVIVGELRQGYNEEACFKWMSRVLQAIDSIHQVNVYCLALVHQNFLPKTPLGGIHVHETRRRFTEGTLHPCNLLLCPHSAITNLPKPRELRHGQVGPSAMMVGNLVAGARLAWAQGREIVSEDDPENNKKHQFLADILQWRATHTPEERLFTVVNQKMQESATITCQQLHKKAERIGSLLLEKGKIGPGAHVAIIYPAGIDLIAAVYGCLYSGCVPVPVKPPHPNNLDTTLETARMIVRCSDAALVLTNSSIAKLLKSKEAQQRIPLSEWKVILDSDDSYRKKLATIYKAVSADQELAYLDFAVSTTGVLSGVKMTHATASALCHAQKIQCEFYLTREAILCLEPYSGLGFVLWCLSSIYCGHHSILVPPQEMECAPWLWLSLCSTRKVRDTFCSYSAIELSTKGLAKDIATMKQKGVSLNSVRSLVIVAEERPRIHLTNSFIKLFTCLGLNQRSVSTSFGCRVCLCICLQGASSPDTTNVYVDTASLRNDRVKILEKGSPNSLCLMESGKLLPGVRLVVANPETHGQCADSQLGELWVAAPHSASGNYCLVGATQPSVETSTSGSGDSASTHSLEQGQESRSGEQDPFNHRLTTGDTETLYARTGFLGFVRRTDLTQSDGERHDAVFVVGALNEALQLRGMRYHPIDIENSIMRCQKKIAECAVFTWSNLLVAVVELDGPEWEAMDLIHPVTACTLEEHMLILGVVVVVDPGSVPINSRGEKQRMLLRDSFVNDKLDPIYVSYNM